MTSDASTTMSAVDQEPMSGSSAALSTPDRKGLIFGECGTTGCENTARWISIHEVRTSPQPFIYRCPACCDRIDGEVGA